MSNPKFTTKVLPEKCFLPDAGDTWHWRRRYFDVGDSVKYQKFGDTEIHEGRIVRIRKNNFARISYTMADGYEALLEDIARAMFGKEFKASA